MSEPAKELTIEERIDADIENVEQQYLENNKEIEKLQHLLNQRLQTGVELKGEFRALQRLKKTAEPLPEKAKDK